MFKPCVILSSLVISSGSAYADRTWDDANDPSNFDPAYVRTLNQLPLEGNLDPTLQTGWADSYWPKVRGSIADRWQTRSSFSKKGRSPTLSELEQMSEAELNLLSPAEKFDLVRGRLDFPISSKIRKDFKENEKDWRGLCNGWSHASLHYREPQPTFLIDPVFGKRVPFGSSDIKALLAHYHAVIDNSFARYIGRSCRPTSRILFNLNGACSDVHPAAFHIMMANELGLRHQGFTADRDPSVQVWNQPFVAYRSRIDSIKTRELSKKATKGTAQEVTVTSELTYVNELYDTENRLEENADHVAPSYAPVLSTQKNRTLTYQYILELDGRGRIIGGEWISELRPDLIWRQDFNLPGMEKDEDGKPDDWSLLNQLVQPVNSGNR